VIIASGLRFVRFLDIIQAIMASDEQVKNPETVDKLLEQINAIRKLPGCPNMFDLKAVQKLANDNEFFELVVFIEDYKTDYSSFILSGTKKYLDVDLS
jgi:hypothetical protein